MQTVVIGLDAFDPGIFEQLSTEGRLPNLTRFAERQLYSRLEVTNPPQSEVSWTSIATGLGPGAHGMFDFVHRDPDTYGVFTSLLPTESTIGGIQFAPPFTARTFFDSAAEQGYPATSLWWPATFPARPKSLVQTIPGLGTPDIFGKLGVGAFFSSDSDTLAETGKIPVRNLRRLGSGKFAGEISGPQRPSGEPSLLEFHLIVDENAARLTIQNQSVQLRSGEWSAILELRFKISRLFSITSVTRVIMTGSEKHVGLYFLPLQIHPLKSPWPYGFPKSFLKRAWLDNGPFLTLGWPQDTAALEEGYISDDVFLALCESIFEQRKRLFLQQVKNFEGGVLGCVFDTLDRIQHMFLRDRPDVVHTWYERCDRLVGEVLRILSGNSRNSKSRVLVLSDHGFAPFRHKVHLNRWLADKGYLDTNGMVESATLRGVNWQNSRAYAIGLNSLYVNLNGREKLGNVESSSRGQLTQVLKQELLEWTSPNGTPIVAQVLENHEAFAGPYQEYGPDLFIGYHQGFRASSVTGLGGWGPYGIDENKDHWGADHCMAADVVPGVIFASSEQLKELRQPSFRDVPTLATGMQPDTGSGGPPPMSVSDEDENAVEDRLRSLGYL